MDLEPDEEVHEGSEQTYEPVPDDLGNHIHSGVKVMEPRRARKGAPRKNS